MSKINCIMLVDDDFSTNRFHQIILKSLQVSENIVFAKHGKQALDYLLKKGEFENSTEPLLIPNLILIDLNMPVMDGFRFIELYTATTHFTEHQPDIIVLSTSLLPEERQKINENKNISMFLNKPLTKDVVKNLMEKCNF